VATLIVSPTPAEEALGTRPETSMHPDDALIPGTQNSKATRYANVIVLAILFAAPALMSIHAACVADPDIWWHLRVGEWIVQHHAVSRVELFSGPFMGKPWLAYSWLFELLVVKLFYHLGLAGIVAYTGCMVLAITAAVWHMVRRLQGDMTLGVLLSFLAIFCCQHLYTPRPWLFSILLFVLELDILMQVRRTGKLRELAWLPLIFALWANTHIEFVYGLAILGLAWAESIAGRWWTSGRVQVRPRWMGCALFASLLATLVNPFGWGIYKVVYDLVTQGGGLKQVSEMQAIPFRDPLDFLVLILALASVAMLAWRRRFPIFETGLLAIACFLSFRSQRDEWTVAVVAAAILASHIKTRRPAVLLPRFATGFALIAATLALWTGFRLMHVNETRLKTQVADVMPVQAVDFIRARGYAGPLYNDFNWGGYLIWALRMPVSIDGRTNLYGNERMDRSIATWNAEPDWASDEQLKSAGLVIGSVKSPLTQVLRISPQFKLVYEDKIAAVFIPQRAH
jgi:hypothetical protein